MKDKLLIITRIKKTIEYVSKQLDNFPKKEIELKKHIIDDLFFVLECCYLANNDYEKDANQNYAMVKISMIDYYFKISYKKDLISKKRYETLSKHLLEINKMISAWKSNYEKKKESV